MAKAATQTKGNTKPAQTKAVATRQSAEVDQAQIDEMNQMMMAHAGKGVSTAVEDNIVPLIYILQSNSPQVQKKGEHYVPGAEAGHIWFRGTKTTVDGEKGILAVPCCMNKCWVEWLPDRGGFVARHDKRPAEAVLTTDPQNPKKKSWKMPNGNSVVETREHVVIVVDESLDRPAAFVIPMTGSGHGASRAWMTKQTQKVIPGTDIPAPAYGYIYNMKLQFRTNDQGDWFMWDVVDAGEDEAPLQLTDPAVFKMAAKICADFESGKLKADSGDQTQVDDSVSGAGENARGQRAAEHI